MPQTSFLAETLDVFGAGLGCHLRLALDHDADLLDDLRVGKGSDVANVHGVGDGGQHPAHDFARARLGHVGNDTNTLGPRDFADHSLDHANDLVFNGLAWREAGLERNVNLRYPPAHLIHHRHHRGFRDLIDGEAGGFQFLGSETMAGHVDYVVDAAQAPVAAVGGLHRAVRTEAWPSAPVLSFCRCATFAVARV